MRMQLQRIHLTDGRDVINSQGLGSDRVELHLQGLQVFSIEMPMQDLITLGFSKASCEFAGIA